MKQPSSAKPRADTTTEYSRSRGGSTSLDDGAVTGTVYPAPSKLTRTGELRLADQAIGRRAIAAGSRPANNQPIAAAATGVTTAMSTRSDNGSGARCFK